MSFDIIQKYNIWAKKSLGQNFLLDERILENISWVIDILWKNILEVWPGYWALTERLLEKHPQALHLVELDWDMIDILEDRKAQWELRAWEMDFQIFQQDVLDFIPKFEGYSVIANIPYYITSPILRYFLYELKDTPENMLILMQQDVGDRIVQKYKNKSSVLSLIVQKKCRVSEKLLVPKESFFPVPKVESSVLLFEVHTDYVSINDAVFLKLIKTWFAEARKKLLKNLIKWWYSEAKIWKFFQREWISENMRAEDLDIELWCRLSQQI